MGRRALRVRAEGLGRSLLRLAALSVLALATGPRVACQGLSRALKPQGYVGIFLSTGKDRTDFTERRVKPREVLFHPALRSPQQSSGHNGSKSQGPPKTFLDLTPAELAKQVLELKHLEPAESQDMLPLILERVGATVVDFFDNFSNTTCTENIISTAETSTLAPKGHYNAKFNYVALVKRGADKTRLQEFRTDSRGEPIQPQGAIVTEGFVGLLAHFHPTYQPDSRFRYLGREVVKGQSTYVVAFAQQPDVARKASRVEFGLRTEFVFVQGVAWIDPASFRILRLRTDLEQPEPHVGLRSETTEVEYSEVTFKEGGKTLWLPREVTVSGQLKWYTFHNWHRYSDYRLFLVQTEERIKNP
jgi:hypothetical protein